MALRAVVQQRTAGTPLVDSITTLLAQRLGSGGRHRYTSGPQHPREPAKGTAQQDSELPSAGTPAVSAEREGPQPAITVSKEFKADILGRCAGFVQGRLEGIADPAEMRDIVETATTEITIVIDELLRKVSWRRSHPEPPSGSQHVGRMQIRRACETLHMPAPSRRGGFDLKTVRQHGRKLLAENHPDRTNGDPRRTANYLAVQEAIEVATRWVEERTR
jgi:hypothetical protein